ncbi:MAG: hypothetical protein KF777_16740 [Planctomycetaceae bacterium]|nr:hypothetical protein [Planctomycetaceae bacterium]
MLPVNHSLILTTQGECLMRRFVLVGVFVLHLVPAVTVCGADANDEAEYLPAIANSGNVEIEAIRISRERVARQAKHADLTNMTVSLWLAWKGEPPERILLQIVELDPIRDNTGKLLTTKQRLDSLPFLKKNFRGNEFKSQGDKNGPVVNLLLDAPAREATTIRSIKGKAVVSEVTAARIDFKDLAAIKKKVLEDPKLKDFKIEADIEIFDGDTELKLQVPPAHERLMWWGLVTNSRRTVPITAESQNGDMLTKTYSGDQTKDTFLGIVIAEPTKSHEMEFQFTDIKLP